MEQLNLGTPCRAKPRRCEVEPLAGLMPARGRLTSRGTADFPAVAAAEAMGGGTPDGTLAASSDLSLHGAHSAAVTSCPANRCVSAASPTSAGFLLRCATADERECTSDRVVFDDAAPGADAEAAAAYDDWANSADDESATT